MRGALIAALALAGSRAATAQDRCTAADRGASCEIEITVRRAPATVMLVVLSEPGVTLPPPTVDRGSVVPQTVPGPVARVFSNTPWQLQLSVAEPFWRATAAGGGSRKAASDLLWAVQPGGPFTALALRPATVATGGAVGGEAVPLFFRATFDAATDAPGEYFLDIVVTLSAP